MLQATNWVTKERSIWPVQAPVWVLAALRTEKRAKTPKCVQWDGVVGVLT